MFQVLKFVLNSIINFMSMLFTINVDSNLSIGLLICICFIFLPMVIRVIRFIKQDALEELDDNYDESRPMQTLTSSYHESSKLGKGTYYRYSNTVTKRRRMR